LADSRTLLGFHHIAFRIEDVNNATQELNRRGVHVVSEPIENTATNLRFAFFADPWGNLFEIASPLDK
jgi:catechol 2,3-dioxygenase-like lactoylglutathione lyase family enzyme